MSEHRSARWDAIVEFPKMKVAIATRDGLVVEICYLPPSTQPKAPANALAEKAALQIESYRANPDIVFDLPLEVTGTPLQKAVWSAMCAIPRGRTRTYGDIAREVGAAFGATARAVGQACGDNRLPIVIPCHRVVAANGLGGFAHATGGYLLEAKRWLLMHESAADEFRLTA